MSQLPEQDRTGFFNVVGAPYVAERHDNTRSHYHRYSDEGGNGVWMASLWLALYVVILGAIVLSRVGGGRIIEMATAFAK